MHAGIKCYINIQLSANKMYSCKNFFHRYFVVVATLSVLILHAKKKDLHLYKDYLVNISVSLHISSCFTATMIPLADIYLLFFPLLFLSFSFFHRLSSLSLPPHALNLLPQSVVVKGVALKRQTISTSK